VVAVGHQKTSPNYVVDLTSVLFALSKIHGMVESFAYKKSLEFFGSDFDWLEILNEIVVPEVGSHIFVICKVSVTRTCTQVFMQFVIIACLLDIIHLKNNCETTCKSSSSKTDNCLQRGSLLKYFFLITHFGLILYNDI
jgi:hypothetical protein